MAVNKLQLKRSAVAGKEPTTSSLALGELAINTYEGKVFLKKDNGVETIVQLADVSGSIFSASYAQTSSHSDNFTVTGPVNVYGSQYISGSLVVGNDITARRLVVQTITSSVIYSSGSNVFGDATSDTQTFTGSVNISGSLNLVGNQSINTGYRLDVDSINVNTITDRSGGRLTLGASTSSVSGFLTVNNSISASGKIEAVSFTGSFSGSINNLQGTATHIPYFSSSQVLADSAMYQVGSASIAINQNGVTTAAPEALYVWQPNTDSFNVISGKGNSDNYLQLNIQNTNQGVSASSDVVATANNGDENNNYINMGINGENFNGPIGEGNDAYLYSTGNNLHIGNTKAGKHVGFFVGGDDAETNKKLQLNPNNQHQMSGSLDASGSITATSFITRGATAAQFVKGDGSLDSTLYTSASVFNNTTSSLQAFSASMLAFTASTLVNSASFDTRINYISSSFNASTASFNAYSASMNAFSASMLSFTASQRNSNGTFATTGSNVFRGNQTITGSLSVSGSTNIFGTTNITGSVNVSGSTGTAITANVDTIVFTGSYAQLGNVNLSSSVDITGSLVVNGRNYINDSSSFDTRINYLSSSFNSSTASINSFTASMNAFSASMLSTTASMNAFSSSVLNFTSSTLVNSASFDTRIRYVSSSFEAATASLNLFSASMLSTTASVNAFSASMLSFTSSTLVNSASFDTRINYISSSFNAFSASILDTTASLNAFSASVLNFTASTLVNSASFDTRINYISSSFEAATASLNLFSASVLSYTASNNATIAKLYAETSSLLANTASMNLFSASMLSYTASTNATIADILIETASLQAFTQSMQNFTASTLINSASFDTRINYLSSSFEANSASLNLFTASFNAFSSSILNTTASINAFSASMLSFTASQKDLNGTLATTGSNTFKGNQVISGSTSITGSLSLTGSQNIIGNLTVTDTITAQRLVVQFITSSVAQITGSTKFGDEVTDTHQFTGSVSISGSLAVNGKDYITESGSFDKRINYVSSSFEAATASLNLFSASILSYTASNNEFVADILTETASLQAATASLNLFSASILSYTASTNLTIADILVETASLQAATASLNLFSASMLSFTASTLVNSASFDTRIQYVSTSFEAHTASFNNFSSSILSTTASINNFSASVLNFTASTLVNSASFDTRINYISSSFEAATASLNAFSASILSYTASNNATIADILIETASLQAATASLNLFSASMLSFTASQKDANGTFATTGSNIFRGNQTVTGSLFTSGSNTLVGSTTLTGSFSVSGSTIQTGNNTLQGLTTLTGSISMSGSIGMVGSITASSDVNIGGVLKLNPTIDPGNFNETSSYLFTSASNTTTGFDLYYRQQNNLVKFKWLEGGISTGLLYGGTISYSGSTIFVKPGSGIINNNNASTGSEINPIFTYVKWGPYTASVQNLTSSQNTYLYVDASGSIFQQTSFFNQTQYEQAIPLGRVTHPNFLSITGYGSNVQTTYDSDTQQNDFIRAFGPIKVSGFSINAHTGSLGLGIGDGIAYNLGGFYSQDPNSPSHYESNGFATASIARAWRSGSSVYLDNNGGSFYTTVDSNYWDDGTGTLNTMSAGDWQIQRVFANPVTGRVVVYYGQNVYTTLLNALQYLATDSFTEGEFTAKSLVFVGYLVLKGQTNNLTDTVNNRIINAGIFRNIAGGSAGGSAVVQRLENLADVVVTTPSNGQALIYDGGNWINSNPLSSSYAANADLLDGLNSTQFVLTSSFQNYSASMQAFSASILNYTASNNATITKLYAETASILSYTASAKIDSGSVSTRLVNLEAFSSSLDATFATDADLNALSSSFIAHTASINAFSASILNYTASNNTTISQLYAETASILAHTASINAFSASINAYTSSNNTAITSLYNATASLNAFSASMLNYTASNNAAIADILLETASFNNFSSSILSYTASNNAAIADILLETASINAFSASINAYTSSNNNTIISLYSATSSLNAFSASMLSFTASQKNLNGTFATTGSNTFEGVQTINSNLVVTGSITAQTLVVQTITSSVDFVTGSTRFGTLLANTHQFTGSVSVTGSLAVNDSNVILTNQTASMSVATASYWSGSINNVLSASYALTASHATNVPETASFANNATSASYSLTASFALNVPQTASFALTASYWSGSINNALSSSYALTASHATNVPETASFANNATSASYALTASFALNVPQTASFALTASYWSGSIRNAVSAAFADIATSASYSATASYALFAVNGGGGGGGGSVTTYQQVAQATTWSISHFLNTQTPVVQVYDDSFNTIIPTTISNPGAFQTFIYFEVSQSGYAVLTTGGGLSVTGSNVILNQTVASTTWSFNHDLKSQYPVFTIFDDNDDVIIPQRIHAATTASAEIYFSTPRTGKAVASLAGFQSLVSSSISSSFATNAANAANATNAQSASYAGNYLLTSSFNTFSGSFVTYSGSVNNRVVALENFSSSLDATFATDADVNAVSASLNAYTASTNAFSASILAYTASNNTTITKLYAETASILAYTASNNTTISALYAQSASINAFSASILSFTSSYNTGSFTGSFVGTASFANSATTASYADNFTVAGTLTAQTLVIQTITSSVIYSSGSNKFGNDLSNTQQLTGSVTVTGSLAVNGSNVVLTNQTASMSVATASFASTASFTPNAIVNAVLDTPLNDTIEFTLGNGTTSLVTINNVGTASLANTASFVQNAQTASYVLNAVSSSFAATASYALNAGGGGISAISIADEGILQGSASYFDFTGGGVSVVVASNTASFTITGGGGSGTQGLTTQFTQSSAAVSWSFTHNLNTRTPVVQVYDSGYNQITPQYISSSNANEVVIGFGIATTGYAVISTGGALVVTGSNVILNQTASATTWSFNHGLNQQYPVFQVFNTDDEVIVPERIKAVDSASALIYFPTPVAGKAIASFAGLSGSIGGGSGAGFPFSGSAVITGSFLVSGSFVDFTNVSSFTGNLTGTASYATFALTASTAPGYTVQFSQTASATTWSFTHNMGTRNPIVQVYDSTYKQIIPNDIVGIDGSTAEIRFDYAQSGFAIMSNGGGLYITGSTSTLIQTSAATTWSFNHRLNTKYPAFEVYDSNDFVIIPANIRAIDTDNAELHFASAQTGRAIANFSGINGLQDNAVSASYAASGSVFHTDKVVVDRSLIDYAQVNSSIVGSNNLFTQATGSYTAAFFKYTVASGSNARAGEVSAVWNGGTTEFMDVSTNDIGNTNAVTASVAIVSGEAQLNFQTNTSAWRIKSTATFM